MTDNKELIGLKIISDTVRGWIEWDERERKREGLQTEDDTAMMSMPVYPSHRMLKNWVELLESTAKELEQYQWRDITEDDKKDGARRLFLWSTQPDYLPEGCFSGIAQIFDGRIWVEGAHDNEKVWPIKCMTIPTPTKEG